MTKIGIGYYICKEMKKKSVVGPVRETPTRTNFLAKGMYIQYWFVDNKHFRSLSSSCGTTQQLQYFYTPSALFRLCTNRAFIDPKQETFNFICGPETLGV